MDLRRFSSTLNKNVIINGKEIMFISIDITQTFVAHYSKSII